jgi:hypothetical protein
MESPKNDGSENPQSGLSSAEYRAKLLTKLNCLIAVLEVAIAKISRSIDLPGTNEERLLKIRSNLENTLSICKRAKNSLVKGIDSAPVRQRSTPVREQRGKGRMSYRDYVELSSIEEYQKFKSMPPIKSEELERIDIDDLVKKLFEK